MKLNKLSILKIILSFIFLINLCGTVYANENSNLKVVFDETRLYFRGDGERFEGAIDETDWYGSSEFSNYLIEEGYSVSKISKRPITYEILKEYDILIILGPDDYYSPQEADEILKFVKEGGGLFLSQRSCKDVISNYGVNRIAQRFGITFANEVELCNIKNNYNGKIDIIKITEFESDPLTDGVESVFFINIPYIKNAGHSKILACTDNKTWADDLNIGDLGNGIKDINEISGRFPVLSSLIYGKGKVVFAADGFFLTNEWLPENDNFMLGKNILKWLTPEVPILRETVYTDENININLKVVMVNSTLYLLGAWITLLGGIGLLFERLENTTTEDGKRRAGNWLKSLAKKSISQTLVESPRWFIKTFDRIFGEKHLTKRCFLRSCVASIIAVIVVGFVWFSQNPIQHEVFFEFQNEPTYGKILISFSVLFILALIFNTLPDYLSLLETRWILYNLVNTGIRKLSVFLIIDVIITGAIFFLFILTISIGMNFYDVGLEAFKEIDFGAFCDYFLKEMINFGLLGIFFYSTYFTSFGFYLFISSSIIVRFLYSLGVFGNWIMSYLDVENKPFRSMGIIACTFISITFLVYIIIDAIK